MLTTPFRPNPKKPSSLPKRLPERKRAMTIVAGFPGNGFVVLAADSDEAGGLAKASVRKVAVIDKGECKCLIGGAGHGDFIDLAVQQLNAELRPPFSVVAVNELIEDIVTGIYSERIDSYPVHEQDDLRFELLCAVGVKDDPIAPQLIRVSRALHLVRTAPETIGAGSYVARYLIATLAPNTASVMFAFRLAVYLVAQVKKHAKDCGGESQVIGITQDGRVTHLLEATIARHEETASIIMERAMPFLLYTTDPYWISRDKVDEAIDFAAAKIKEELAEAMPQLPAPPAQPTQGELPVITPEATATPSTPSVETDQQPVRRDRSVTMRERRSLPPSQRVLLARN
jgi:20S proteasome alpha/beta subunit